MESPRSKVSLSVLGYTGPGVMISCPRLSEIFEDGEMVENKIESVTAGRNKGVGGFGARSVIILPNIATTAVEWERISSVKIWLVGIRSYV